MDAPPELPLLAFPVLPLLAAVDAPVLLAFPVLPLAAVDAEVLLALPVLPLAAVDAEVLLALPVLPLAAVDAAVLLALPVLPLLAVDAAVLFAFPVLPLLAVDAAVLLALPVLPLAAVDAALPELPVDPLAADATDPAELPLEAAVDAVLPRDEAATDPEEAPDTEDEDAAVPDAPVPDDPFDPELETAEADELFFPEDPEPLLDDFPVELAEPLLEPAVLPLLFEPDADVAPVIDPDADDAVPLDADDPVAEAEAPEPEMLEDATLPAAELELLPEPLVDALAVELAALVVPEVLALPEDETEAPVAEALLAVTEPAEDALGPVADLPHPRDPAMTAAARAATRTSGQWRMECSGWRSVELPAAPPHLQLQGSASPRTIDDSTRPGYSLATKEPWRI